MPNWNRITFFGGKTVVDAETIRIGESAVHAHLWTRSQGSTRGHVILVHGLGDHGGRYRGFAQRILRRRFGVLAIDLPGHGRSPGRRGKATHYSTLLRTIADARRCLVDRFGKTPQILLGHSMGGNLVMNYALRRKEFDPPWMPDLDAMVLVAPMLMPPQVIDRARLVAAWITGHLFRWVRLSRNVRVDQLTSDPNAAALIESDPLQHSQVSLYLATQLLAQGRFAIDHANEIKVPTLVLVGDEDELIDRAACRHLAFRMQCADVVCWPDGLHDLLHDVDSERLIDLMVDRMDQKSVPFSAAKAA
ncbi:MAG: lysophospholipase [Planctomycetota bacterium]